MGILANSSNKEPQSDFWANVLYFFINGRDLRPEKLKNKNRKPDTLTALPDLAETVTKPRDSSLPIDVNPIDVNEFDVPFKQVHEGVSANMSPPCESEIADKTSKEYLKHMERVAIQSNKAKMLALLENFDELNDEQRMNIVKELIAKQGEDKLSAREVYYNRTGDLLEGVYYGGSLKSDELLDIIINDPHPGVRLAAVECTTKYVESIARKAYSMSNDSAVKQRLSALYSERTDGRSITDDVLHSLGGSLKVMPKQEPDNNAEARNSREIDS